jgi:hypothetical protein
MDFLLFPEGTRSGRSRIDLRSIHDGKHTGAVVRRADFGNGRSGTGPRRSDPRPCSFSL